MTSSDPLRREVCRLARAFHARGLTLTIGGGLGLLLRDEHLRRENARTLRSYPPLRSTLDIDVFLTRDVIVDAEQMRTVRGILEELGYAPRDEARYFQFIRGTERDEAGVPTKVDLLAALPDAGSAVKVSGPRIRPHGYDGLHARVTREAFSVERDATEVPLNCNDDVVVVRVPHPFSHVIMKLHAFRDRIDDPDPDLSRYHAFDIYVAVAMLTEAEFERAGAMRLEYEQVPEFVEAQEIRREHFGRRTDLGPVRLHEHIRNVRLDERSLQLREFLEDLQELVG